MQSRIKELRKSVGMTQTEFGLRLGVTTSAISGYELGTRSPSDAILKSICREFNVNETWLRTGDGDMFVDLTRHQEMSRLVASLMADRPESFRSALITTLLRFSPDGPEWALLEDIYRRIAAEMEEAPEP